MYDHLYSLLDRFDTEVVVHADHPTLNRRVAEMLAAGERIDVLATHSKYAPSQAHWLRPLDGMAAHLRRAEEASRTIDPMLPERLKRERKAVDALFEAMRADAGGGRPGSTGLVEMGLRLFSDWFE